MVIPKAIQSLGIEGSIVLAVSHEPRFHPNLKAAGFQVPISPGMSLLPAIVGPVTRFNAEGKYLVRKDLPMETAYRQIEWSWEQWSGPYTETVTEIREVPYKRYPRDFVPPPGVELSCLATLEDHLLITTPSIDLQTSSNNEVCHRINLMLEIFGECDVLREDLSNIVRAPVTRLNWRALPPGQRSWDDLKNDLEEVIQSQPKGNQGPLIFRLKAIHDRKPDFVAIGSGGFKDYVVFGFTDRNIFILESPMMDNATYVFGSNWDDLAKLTKTELIAGGLASARLIHRNSWIKKLAELF